MGLAWVFLLMAIVTEVAGTMSMGASGHTGNPWMYALMFLLISLSYTFLSFALRKISVGIAIAIWEGLGTSLIAFISMVFLNERASSQKIAGIVLALLGILLLHFGEKEAETPGLKKRKLK
jgi:spermidine export protein MdtJ